MASPTLNINFDTRAESEEEIFFQNPQTDINDCNLSEEGAVRRELWAAKLTENHGQIASSGT